MNRSRETSEMTSSFCWSDTQAERFLYRLGTSPVRDRCILKGAALPDILMDELYLAPPRPCP